MLNKVPQDKNGKPLKFGYIVQGSVINGTGPPKSIMGKWIGPTGPNKSLIEAEGRSYVVENKTIEVKID